VDGADEIAPKLDLIKGGGGAHFREKLVAQAARTFLVIADAGKEVPRLGTRFALPLEVPTFAVPSVLRSLAELNPRLRAKSGVPVVTDNGHHVVDLATGPIADPRALARRIDETVGVLEHGLFLGMADEAILADAKGVRTRKE
jgi:ribose 5-phosphate isomerase A